MRCNFTLTDLQRLKSMVRMQKCGSVNPYEHFGNNSVSSCKVDGSHTHNSTIPPLGTFYRETLPHMHETYKKVNNTIIYSRKNWK